MDFNRICLSDGVILRDCTYFTSVVIGLPNEEIDIKNRTVFINGIIQEQGIGVTNPNSDFPIMVDENCVFVLGDNRNLSNDSRAFGCVPVEQIDGQLAVRIWPINKFQLFR